MVRALLAEIDDEGSDLFFRQRLRPCRHVLIRNAVSNAAGQALVVATVRPIVVEQRGRLHAFEMLAMTGSAELEITLVQVAGVRTLRPRGVGEAAQAGEEERPDRNRPTKFFPESRFPPSPAHSCCTIRNPAPALRKFGP